tara:strand:- start:230 stop:622 length:393 start_codon:yes stop_codon:yes gene_type:complete
MNEDDVIQTLGTRLETLTSPLFVLWEDQDLPVGQPRPYLRFELNPTVPLQLISGAKQHVGFAQIMVVTETGGFGSEANRISREIADLFEYETRLACANGWLDVTTHTTPRPAFRSGDDWLKPVQVNFIAM